MKLYEKFSTLLDSEPYEQKIHSFLAEHPEILLTCISRNREVELLSKPNIHKFEIDFAVSEFWPSTGKRDWTLIEIERSIHRLFTKDGDPTAELTHSIRQIVDWRGWIENNLAYARKILPGIQPIPNSMIIIGRRHTLSEKDKSRLSIFIAGLYKITIRTYDHLLDICRTLGK